MGQINPFFLGVEGVSVGDIDGWMLGEGSGDGAIVAMAATFALA
jgi:hypothetical protein